MKEREIVERLQRAITDTPIDLLDTLQKTDVQKMTERDHYTRQEEIAGPAGRSDFFAYFRPLMTAAVLLLAVGLGWLWTQMPLVTLYLDINPSIKLELTRFHTVKHAESYNPDGKALLAKLDLVGKKRDEALRLLNAAVPGHTVTMVSVDTEDARLQDETENAIRILLESSAVVLSQPVQAGDTSEYDAQAYQISPGKLELIRKILAAGSVRNADQLAQWPLDQLITALFEEDVDIRTLVRVDGDLEPYRPDPAPPVEIIWPEPEPATEPPVQSPPPPPVVWDDDDAWDDDGWDDDAWDDDEADDDEWDD